MPLHGAYEPSPRPGVRDQVAQYEATDGAQGRLFRGRPVVILTSRAAKTGVLRKNPLIRVEDNGRYAVVSSDGSAPTNPAWYHNVSAHPEVELQDGAVRRDMRAREVHGAEKAEWWQRALSVYPEYSTYQKNVDREIPVFVLEPVAD
ncbi:deazaflavin-dependent oxidoreductase, nitroreductase family [Streptomyces sp. DvalAA-14]|uniref:nitroreductase family deazaflavin-dependent oxidoreductase n=1 Tax=unclassified Streptomyces TaxID=2593676 RepID=UPI00081B128B|nr:MULTISPECIES: nitroreductase family deazaflavin-dependent oxidoreductase [unclassified Streptomyces]MYS23472.1 nitroreductase family deazaflavin-dependent oxidoreductase [Streptomyces sp. SID4948]SCE33780.1 deazaflavin-dependent oxidoreductase, nitroreductase family [Streptomyces sp. DvalAA-14]